MWFVFALACSEYELERPLLGGDVDGDGVADDADGVFDTEDGRVIDTFDVANQSDILVFGDTSTSMEPELLTMNAHIEGLVGRLETFQTDWHLLAVTGPSGCSPHGWVDRATPDWSTRFAEDLLTHPGEDLVDEWGLNNVVAAAQNADDGCNAGFLRPDALLHVVFISDEDDNSPGFESGGEYWRPYVDDLRAITPYVKLSAVGGPVPEACEGAEPGHGYWEAVQATEGTFISICSDWENQVEDLANTFATQRTFTLSEPAVAGSVEVAVDAEIRDDGWAFDEAANAVVFTNSAPIAGQHVEIAYQPR